MARFTLEQAEKDLSRLLADARAGEEVVIVEGELPVARIVPIRPDMPAEPRRPGLLKGRIDFDERFFEPLPEEELRLWNEGP